jgi:uncharacterized protein YqjF (DUF2071 family)
MAMRWHDLLFLHRPIAAAALREKVPEALELDQHSGSAWLGVVPFRMSNVRPRGVPGLPWLSAFPELNVRTYVTHGGKPGVWFFSLDAARLAAVVGARALFHLPYFHARMTCREQDGTIRYSSERLDPAGPAAEFRARYVPSGPVFLARPGSLEHFLTARYCLFARDRDGGLWRGDIDHAPWPLQPARCEVERDTMIEAGIGAARNETPLLHFARRLDVVAWSLKPIDPTAA